MNDRVRSAYPSQTPDLNGAFERSSVSHAVHADRSYLSFLHAGSIGKNGLLGQEEGHNNVSLPDTHANHGKLQDPSSIMTWSTRRRHATVSDDVPIDLALPVCGAVVAYGLVLAAPRYRVSAGPPVIAFNDLFSTVFEPNLLVVFTGISLLLIRPGFVGTAAILSYRSQDPGSLTHGIVSLSLGRLLALAGGLSVVQAAVFGFVAAGTPMDYESDSLPSTIVVQEERLIHGTDGLEIPDDHELARTLVDIEGCASVERSIAVTPTMTGSDLRRGFYLCRIDGPADPSPATADRFQYVGINVEAANDNSGSS